MPIHTARAFTAAFVIALMPFTLFAKDASPYPRLSDNTAASETLEVRKVLHGHVDGMFVVPRTQQVVVAAGGYLWKFSAQGELLDTLREQGRMYTSGLMFTPDYYTDWVFTGDAKRKAFASGVDGNNLTRTQVLDALQRAEVVEFAKKDTAFWAYLWTAGRAWKMDLTNHREAVDTYCQQRTHSAEALRWDATCFEGLKRPAGLWTEVEPGSFAGYGDATPRAEVARFERRKFHLEEGLSGQAFGLTIGAALKAMGVPGSLPGRYWFGDAYTRLHVGNEVLQFKAFIPYEDGDYRYFYNMRWWEPSTLMPAASPWFTVHMRTYMERSGEEALLKYYEKDIGLYVVRPRGKGVPAGSLGDAAPAWHPVFEGPATNRAAVTGTVEFDNAAPTHVWLRKPAPGKRYDGTPPVVYVEALWPDLHQLPKTLTVKWRAPVDDDNDPTAVLRVELSPADVQAAFARMRGAKAPVELVVQLPDLYSPAQAVQVQLRSSSTQIALAPTRVAYTQQPVPPRPKPPRDTSEPSGPPPYLPLLKGLEAQAEKAQSDPAKQLQPLLEQARTLAQHPEHARALAPGITAMFADLLNRYNNGRKLTASATLVRYYLAQVYPLTKGWHDDSSQAYNQSVIASQTMAFAIHSPPDRDLVDGVLATLIGPNFDPTKQTNGTLMYNLACYYAVEGNTPGLVQSTTAARRLGKPKEQFMSDTDFEKYWQNAEFLKALATRPES